MTLSTTLLTLSHYVIASPAPMLNGGAVAILEEDVGGEESLSRVIAFETLPYGKS